MNPQSRYRYGIYTLCLRNIERKGEEKVLGQSSRKGDKTKDTELLSEPHIIIF